MGNQSPDSCSNDDFREKKQLRFMRDLVCYTAVFSVVTQRSSPQTAAENRTTFFSLCVCGLTNKPITYLEIDCDVSFRG